MQNASNSQPAITILAACLTIFICCNNVRMGIHDIIILSRPAPHKQAHNEKLSGPYAMHVSSTMLAMCDIYTQPPGKQ
jgi:hypothetical protein